MAYVEPQLSFFRAGYIVSVEQLKHGIWPSLGYLFLLLSAFATTEPLIVLFPPFNS